MTVVAIFGVLMFGTEPGQPMVPLALIAALVLAVLTMSTVHRRGVADRPWSGAEPVPMAFVAARSAPSTRSVAAALGRVEARELVSSGAFGIGVGFCGLIVLLFGGVWGDENTEPWFALAQQAPWFCLPLVGMSVVAAHRAVTRDVRDGTDELFASCPVPPETRTTGFLLSAVTPVAMLVGFLAILAVLIGWRSAHVYGPLAAVDWADVASSVVLAAGGVALGVALGRWLRFALVPIVAVVAVGFVSVRLNEIGGHDWNRYIGLSMSPTIERSSPVFDARPAFAHLGWILGLTAVVAVVALTRHRRDRTIALTGAVAAAAVVLCGIAATRPMSNGSAERIAMAIAHPEQVQECTEAGKVSICLYPVHRPLLDRLLLDVAPVESALPASVGHLTLRQRFDDDLVDLAPEVRRLLTADDVVVPKGEIPLDFSEDVQAPVGAAARGLAYAAVGLPTEPDAALRPTVVAGQARGVVALWLTTLGRSRTDALELTSSPLPDSADAYDRGSLVEGDCSEPAVVWSGQDLAAARAVVALPSARVAAVIHDGWARWTDPSTGTDELLAALGVAGVGPFDHVEARPGDPC